MVALNCKETYPDIFTPVPDTEPPNGPTYQDNLERKRLYLAVRRLLQDNFGFDPDGSTTARPEDFPAGFGKRGKSSGAKIWDDLLREEKVLFVSVYGILRSRNYTDPSLGKLDIGLPGADDIVFVEEGETVLIVDRFIEATTEAVKRYNANKQLFIRVFEVLLREGAELADDGTPISTTVVTRQVAEVTGRLIDQRISADNPQIRRFVINALSQALGDDIEGNEADTDIRLPDLDVGTAVEIIGANVDAVSLVYFSAMLEELKFYAVMDKIAEQFMVGMVPVSRGPAGNKIYEWIRRAPERFTEIERRGIYGRVLGLAQGSANEGVPNREFPDLWLRFLSTVNLLHRDKESRDTKKVVSQQAHKAARDLAVNLSLHGYGVAHFAAIDMQRWIGFIQDVLSQGDLLKAYGVNDRWQLVERVSSLYLNGAMNGVRYRTMANSGGKIIGWIADRAPQLSAVNPPSDDFFLDPFLVSHVNQLLAVTGTGIAVIDQRVEPVDLSMQPTIPTMSSGNGASHIASSPVIRSALEQAGIGNLPGIPV